MSKIFKKNQKNFIVTLVLFLVLLGYLSAYETVKATKISNNVQEYKNKAVLVFIKFGNIGFNSKADGQGIFTGFNVKDIDYVYDLNNVELVDRIEKLKQRDRITVKGIVDISGFSPIVLVEDFLKGWIDTTLLPPTPNEVLVSCPKCGETFNHKITKDDYKKSQLLQRKKGLIEDFSGETLQKPLAGKEDFIESLKSTVIKQEVAKQEIDNGWIL
ncbi:MAG: hypothetical protein GY817_02675 [bacterium]|nr:hypothetical protein [bacterium]